MNVIGESKYGFNEVRVRWKWYKVQWFEIGLDGRLRLGDGEGEACEPKEVHPVGLLTLAFPHAHQLF